MELYELADYLRKKYGSFRFTSVRNVETGEFMFYVFLFDGYGWDEWKGIELDLNSKQKYTRGYVTVMCLGAFNPES